jgi:PAS domain S-box-containing protein
MTTEDRSELAADLRRQAEAIMKMRAELPDVAPPGFRPKDTSMGGAAIDETLHELRVHQIELELQNEELRRVQAELEASRANYFDLFDQAPVGYCTLSEPGQILGANQAVASLVGMEKEDLAGWPITRFILPEDQDIYYLMRRRLLTAGLPQSCVLRMLRADEIPFWVSLEESAVEDVDGALVSRLVISDISELRRGEEERACLEQRIAEARKLESVGRLAGGVAHYINNMMSAIIGYSGLALSILSSDDPVYKDVSESLTAAQKSADMVRQLLAFAQRQTVAPKVLDLNGTVAGMVKDLALAAGKDIQLEWRPAAELWPVKVDPVQFDQILRTLCDHARDTLGGRGRIALETGTLVLDKAQCAHLGGLEPGEYVRLCVSDDGPGLDAEALHQVFEPFFATKGAAPDSGLGLAMVYGAIRQNNGFIDVKSKAGEGTSFTIYLPRHLPEA